MRQLKPKREAWGSRLGIIMAVAGSALGLGVFCFTKIFSKKVIR